MYIHKALLQACFGRWKFRKFFLSFTCVQAARNYYSCLIVVFHTKIDYFSLFPNKDLHSNDITLFRCHYSSIFLLKFLQIPTPMASIHGKKFVYIFQLSHSLNCLFQFQNSSSMYGFLCNFVWRSTRWTLRSTLDIN